MCRRLAVPALTVEVRGHGGGRFIYAYTGGQAFEASIHEFGFFFEGWDHCDPESDEGPVISEEEISSLKELEERILGWIER